MQQSHILDRVMRAIALNRAAGFHFAGRFLDADFEPVKGGMRAMLESGPHCIDANGEVDLISLCIFFDIALGVSIRSTIGHNGRMATTNINLRLNGVARRGAVRTEARFQGMTGGTEGQFGSSCLELTGADGVFGYATGQFAVISRGVIEAHYRRATENPSLARAGLTDEERVILGRAEAALRDRRSFIEGFWGVDCRATDTGAVSTTANGTHLGNRVGHLQGGVQLGIAEVTAAAALGPGWLTTGIDASYLRPGEGREFRGVAELLHRGRTTAVVSTRLLDERGRAILASMSTHAKRMTM